MDKPFYYWCGATHAHRPYKLRYADEEKRLDEVEVPPVFPDVPEVRRDLLRYYRGIEEDDLTIGRLIARLEALGELDNTIVVITADNGMPLPRAKCNLYDLGVREPLAIRWGDRVSPGRVVQDFVSRADLAPTLLEAAGVAVPDEMTGRSFLNVLLSDREGQVDPTRDAVVTARERHSSITRPGGVGYPIRAHDYLYLYVRNFRPDRDPTFPPPRS